MNIDKAAHELMNFEAGRYSVYENGRYRVLYHEEKLYSVRDTKRNTVTLVKASNPDSAYCLGRSLTQVNQYGDNAINITGSVATFNL